MNEIQLDFCRDEVLNSATNSGRIEGLSGGRLKMRVQQTFNGHPISREEFERLLVYRVRNATVDDKLRLRYKAFVQKALNEPLEESEHTEMLCLFRVIKKFDESWQIDLLELAQLRRVSVTQLMSDLNVTNPSCIFVCRDVS